ncbi:MAG: RNA-binding transcriptional accessory protein [Endozoicomonadaceae bacterium]|nr:RNA-binding transcriptional accessory protein [Endozoicomonadaceae bacterium]
MENFFQQITSELQIKIDQVKATVVLLDGGATVPFIARYRKEATHSLNDTQLRIIEERLYYFRELDARKESILKTIKSQDKLTSVLKLAIQSAETKTKLEDLYLPYKPKKQTKGQLAIQANIEPLADLLWSNPTLDPETEAKNYINPEKEYPDCQAVLKGAKFILIERFSQATELIGKIREFLTHHAVITSCAVEKNKAGKGKKYDNYFAFHEKIKMIPSHRILALLRGRKENALTLSITLPNLQPDTTHPCQEMIADFWQWTNQNRSADAWLEDVLQWTWSIKISPHMETDLISQLRIRAEQEAIHVFSNNLKDLLLTAPAGTRVTMGLDPGLRTGVKVAVVNQTGQLLNYDTIYPHVPHNRKSEAQGQIIKLILKHQVELIAIGNGTASRETERFIAELASQFPHLTFNFVIVSEAGASIYSASQLAAEEFPDLDVVFRGAASIARRLQDPLAELVKIEPKSIGVGQYQHDVNQVQLSRSLNATVEDCVNAVGVDLNTASPALLNRIAGLSNTLAHNIVQWRNEHGVFLNRQQLMSVPQMGQKSFEQSAGFLRIQNAKNPLDTSAVHPEAYSIVEKMAAHCKKSIEDIIGEKTILDSLSADLFINDTFGLPTIIDILSELKKPGRDPRPEFKAITFTEGIETIADLKLDMILDGVISNVTNFGAFVNIGVHQDGLIHISSLAQRFVKNPRDIVKTGEIVTVKVISIDCEQKRIGLSMKLDNKHAIEPKPLKKKYTPAHTTQQKKTPIKKEKKQGTFAELFENAKKLRR